MRDAGAPCVGAIVAGGGATRFGGRPKGLERVGGRRIVDRVAGALRPAADALVLVANAPDAAAWLPGVPVVRDPVPGAGALGGLLAALDHAAALDTDAGVLAVAWDMPFVPPSLLGELRRLAAAHDAALVAPAGADGGIEPLCAWYGPACRAVVGARVARGALRLRDLVGEVPAVVVPAERVVDWGDPARLFLNVNTPDDLALARRIADDDPPRADRPPSS